MVTIKDIANRAGVSMITVSRVVNSNGYVGAATREKVEAAIRELNYVPNKVASNLRSQQSDLLALVLPDITNSFWTTIARGVEDAAWPIGYGVFICNADNNPDKEAAYIETLLRRRVGGVLIVPTPDPQSEAQLDRLRQHGTRFVVVHRKLRQPIADVVRSDSQDAARKLTAALIADGWTRIAYVGLPLEDPASVDRLNGYREAHDSAGIEPAMDLVRVGPLNPSTGYRLVTELLELSPRPEAILLGNSRLAVGGLRAIGHAGLKVPDDIAVAAFHDTSALDDYAPTMIRAVQPSYAMGKVATELLLDREGRVDGEYREIVLPAEFHRPGDYALGEIGTVSRDSVRYGAI
jgi:LacI family transcriptional regulator